jgi:hypothetical protein
MDMRPNLLALIVPALLITSAALAGDYVADTEALALYEASLQAGDILPTYAVQPPAHQWIAFQAYNKLPAGPLKSELAAYLPTDPASAYYASSWSPSSAWTANDNSWAAASEALLEGVVEEDAYDPFGLRSINHFWNPDGTYDEGLTFIFTGDSALVTAQANFAQALTYYSAGNKAGAYYWLGRTAHLMADMAIPAHVQLDVHIPGDVDNYETYTGTGDTAKAITSDSPETDIPDYASLPAYPRYTPASFSYLLTNVVYSMANDTDRFDSDDYDGDSPEYGGGKYRTAGNYLDTAKTFSHAALVTSGGSLVRAMSSPADYIQLKSSVAAQSAIMYSKALYNEIYYTTYAMKVYYTDGTSTTFADYDYYDDVPYASCALVFQPHIEARAVAHVAALYQLFWAWTHAGPDADMDGNVDFVDFARLAGSWTTSGCTETNNWCHRGDFDRSGSAGMTDLRLLAQHWLQAM